MFGPEPSTNGKDNIVTRYGDYGILCREEEVGTRKSCPMLPNKGLPSKEG